MSAFSRASLSAKGGPNVHEEAREELQRQEYIQIAEDTATLLEGLDTSESISSGNWGTIRLQNRDEIEVALQNNVMIVREDYFPTVTVQGPGDGYSHFTLVNTEGIILRAEDVGAMTLNALENELGAKFNPLSPQDLLHLLQDQQ